MVSDIKMTNKPRVKLIAVAKDEAAYLPEWVHHHLYFGFDAIDIYVNRTSDNSWAMLSQLRESNQQLNFLSADWVDTCPLDVQRNLQYVIYAKAFEENRLTGSFDYIMFMDIDEYWTPQNMQWSIQDCILAHDSPASLSFSWINEHGSDVPFSPLQIVTAGQMSPLVKTVISLKAELLEMSLHLPRLNTEPNLMVDGDHFIPDATNRECLHGDLQHLRTVMIIHRMFRSQLEYVSLLSRGRPSDELPLKLNRGGYNKSAGTHVTYSLNQDYYDQYIRSFNQFLAKTNVSALLLDAQQFVQKRYQITLEAITKMPSDYYDDLFIIFKGCGKDIKKQLIDSIKHSHELTTCHDEDKLLNIATKLQKHDAFLARDIANMANKR
jgi:hypothetical protein